MTPSRLIRRLRRGSSPFLRNRRRATGLGLLAAGSMGLITLYQTGLIHHLPEPPLPGFDADRVDASPEAFARLRLPMPDAPIGLVSYATTIALASDGGFDRSRTHPWVPIALMAMVAIDAVQAGKLT